LEHDWFKLNTTSTEIVIDPEVITNLRNYKIDSKFKKECLALMVNMLKENEIDNLTQNFR
jgi:hypothetical protein